MKTKLFKAFALLLMIPLMVTAAKGQSAYSNLVMSLNPVAYWPLQESTPAPRYDMETNYGSLGTIGNMYYFSTATFVTNFGAFPNDSSLCQYFPSGNSKGAIVPTTDNRVGLPFTQQFTVEGWFRLTGTGGYAGIINQTGGQGSGGINDTVNSAGWELVNGFSPYRTATPNSPSVFAFHVFNGTNSTGGADVEVTNAEASEWNTGGATGYANSWVYLACTFDGTNALIYMYSTNLVSGDGGTNEMVYQIPISSGINTAYFGTPTLTTYTNFVADVWDPILLGETRSYNGNDDFSGFMQDLAIYTNALTSLQISNHFNAGTNGLGNYQATILGDNPFMHWRMNAPLWTNNLPENTFPVANNYGSAASTFTNNNSGISGANSAVYQPGTLPGYPSLTGAGFGPFTNACAFNGLEGVVDVGVSPAINPTGSTNNYSLVAWFKGNPMDSLGTRYQCPASHGDLSWKAQFHEGTTFASTIGSGSSAQIAPNATTYYPNDGNWHMYTFVARYTNGVTTNLSVYLDYGASSATLANPGSVPGSNTMDAVIGGDPDVGQYAAPTNYATWISGEQEFAGQVAHVAFFTNALTLNQIQNLYFTAEPGLVIATQPLSATINAGAAFTNTVVAAGGAPYSYQWFTNGVALAGQTGSNLVINPVVPGDASADYYVVVQSDYGMVTSAVVSLMVISVPTLTSQVPQPYTNLFSLYPGANPVFSVSVKGPQLNYQWFTNGVLDSADTASNLELTDVQASFANDYCIAGNSYGSVTSMVWSAQVLPSPMNSSGGLASYPQQVLEFNPIAYWRMNDANLDGQDNGSGDDGYICNDYINGDDGIYTNVYLLGGPGSGYNPVNDPSDGSATFEGNNSDANSILAPDFSTPNGVNAEFTVSAWANPEATMSGTPTVVAKGGYNQEEFTMDAGATGESFRFEVRNAVGTAFNANSTLSVNTNANQNQWYHLVGVCDEANSNVFFYIDGQLAGTAGVSSALYEGGITNSSTTPLTIGSRSSTDSPTNNNEPFAGSINDVAIFNYAMTSNQVEQLFSSNGIVPIYSHQPVNTEADYGGGTTTLSAGVSGATSYQWFNANTGQPITGQTNATLVLSNLTASANYYVVAYNPYGSSESATVSVNVISGGPQIYVNPANAFFATVGQVATNVVTAYGTWPLAYQWQYSTDDINWTNVSGYRFSGQTNILTISDVFPGDAGYYQVVVTNTAGSATSSPAQLTVLGVPLTFNTNGANGGGLFWTANGSSECATNVLTLTYTNSANSAGTASYFYQIPQYVGAFEASFTYEALYAGSQPMADGATFCIQDDPRGASAIGLGGGDLAVLGSTPANPPASGNTITPSVELELNIYPGNGVGGMGYSLDTDGAIGPTAPPGSVVLTNIPVNVTIYYVNGQMALTFSNEVSGATYSTSENVGSIPQILGTNTALVGFTGSYGGDWSLQTITNFSFVSLATQTIAPNGTNVVVSWPASIAGYTLQESSSLTSGNWVNVTNVANVVNGQNEVIVPNNSTNMFYRLVLLP